MILLLSAAVSFFTRSLNRRYTLSVKYGTEYCIDTSAGIFKVALVCCFDMLQLKTLLP